MATEPLLLGVECGGSHTSVVLARASLADENVTVPAREHWLGEWKLGPANFRMMTDQQWLSLFTKIRSLLADTWPVPSVGIAIAGARHADQHAHVEALFRSAVSADGDTSVRVSHDLESALLAAGAIEVDRPRMIVIAGTGSCCYGRTARGEPVRGGGWGHLLGDQGSGFALGSALLQACTVMVDRCRRSGIPYPNIVQEVLQAAGGGNSSWAGDTGWDVMIDWVANASKDAVANLAPICLKGAAAPGAITECVDIVRNQADALSMTAADTMAALVGSGQQCGVLLYGGLFFDPVYRDAFVSALSARSASAVVAMPEMPSVAGALEMARASLIGEVTYPSDEHANAVQQCTQRVCFVPPLASLGIKSPTELRNPRSTMLDKMPTEDAVAMFLAEDTRLPAQIAKYKDPIARLVDVISSKLRQGGRLLYCGAGTSGRLGVLDASECPPTFGSQHTLVQGLIAGGPRAILRAVEGAEDSAPGGEADMAGLGANGLHPPAGPTDVVIGIAASGRTPYVWGALAEAKRRKATTGLLCFNPAILEALALPEANGCEPDHVLAIDVGPELLTGSTRLKAGTATKLILNIITTLAVGVGQGKIASNLMIDMTPTNDKLKDRAVRILRELLNTALEQSQIQDLPTVEECRQALQECGWVILKARDVLCNLSAGGQ